MRRKSKGRKRTVIALIAVLTVILALGGLFIVHESGLLVKPHGLEGVKYSLPISVKQNPELEGIDIQFSEIELEHEDYEASPIISGKFNCTIQSGEFEIITLQAIVRLLDSEGVEISKEIYWMLQDDYFSLQPGEKYIFDNTDKWHSFYTDDFSNVRKVNKVVVEFENVERIQAAGNYPDSEVLDVDWDVKRIEGLDLEICARIDKVEVLHESDLSSRQFLLLRFKNTGQIPCNEIAIKINYYNDYSNEIDYNTYKILSLHNNPLNLGEALVYFIDETFYPEIFDFPEPFNSYKIEILTAR